MSLMQQLVGSLLSQNQSQSPNGAAYQPNPPCAANGGKPFENLDVSSTGDPHLAAVGTREGAGGGYRVSTTVTQPGANGVTWNQSATVHANFDQTPSR